MKEYPHLDGLQKIAKRRKVGVYLVGGFLRDFVLDRENRDLDFTVSKDALKLAQSFAKDIKGTFVLLDEDHGCARVVKKIKGELITYDFADYKGKTIEDDLASRDFTINTLALNIDKLASSKDLKGIIEDRKRAKKDIEAKRIKRVSIRSFREDPLRMLRAFALKASLGFRIELTTLNQIKKEKDGLYDVSPERIRDELFKILESDKAAQTLKQMDKIGILSVIMPQIKVMYNCPQGTYHHLDVWPHSLETVVQIEKLFKTLEGDEELTPYLSESLGGGHSRRSLIKLAALLHDIGKPDTRKKEGERYSFHGHEHVGASIAKIILKNLKLSTQERKAIEDMVRWHLRPGYLSNSKRPSEKAYFRYFRKTKKEAVSIALLSIADQHATRGPATTQAMQHHHTKICQDVIKRYFAKLKEKPFVPFLTGEDLIKKLKLEPSPLFGKILGKIEEEQVLGKVKTKTDALKRAKALL